MTYLCGNFAPISPILYFERIKITMIRLKKKKNTVENFKRRKVFGGKLKMNVFDLPGLYPDLDW